MCFSVAAACILQSSNAYSECMTPKAMTETFNFHCRDTRKAASISEAQYISRACFCWFILYQINEHSSM
jgi:hypothetical protein